MAPRLAWFVEAFAFIERAVNHAIVVRPAVLREILVCVLSGGHLLVEDLPGTGKTTLARRLAAVLGSSWSRVQCTHDLLPADIVGGLVLDPATNELAFRAGPIFANMVLVDELNRAAPRTQSALLEVMEEQQVTVDGTSHPVPLPFWVIATQNPVDQTTTFLLPAAELDRFTMSVSLGQLDAEGELMALRMPPSPPPVGAPLDELALDQLLLIPGELHVSEAVLRYVADLSVASRGHDDLVSGASTRASRALVRAARVLAAAEGRAYVTPDDVSRLLPSVYAHRLVVDPARAQHGVTARAVCHELLARTPVPSPGDLLQ